jgi:hypothetical protein
MLQGQISIAEIQAQFSYPMHNEHVSDAETSVKIEAT